MNQNKLDAIFTQFKDKKIGVIGDFSLDAYWEFDPSRSEVSLETGLPTCSVRTQRLALAGAGNVAANLRSLGAGNVAAFAVIGADLFGREMTRLLSEQAIDSAAVIVQAADWQTQTFAKPIVNGHEENRLDFGNFNTLSEASRSALLTALRKALPDLDAVVINQQAQSGMHNCQEFRAGLREIIEAHPDKLFLLDSRDYCNAYAGTIRKINQHEAAALGENNASSGATIPLAEMEKTARTLHEKWGQTVFITRGEDGALAIADDEIHTVLGLQLLGQLDAVGAGDSFLAGITAALATGAKTTDVLALGNFAAAVTTQKRLGTGTASPEEIRAIADDTDYYYESELAVNPRRARYHENTEIEIVRAVSNPPRLAYAIFDHDGTISTLRRNWEPIMEQMMVKAILGDKLADTDDTTYANILACSRDFIDKTTGIQTLKQMVGLVELVREYGYVPAAQILDAQGYKDIYNDALMEMVRGRVAKYESGELGITDYTMKNALPFLERLHEAGVKLYLASGTDEPDVKNEAAAMGYAKLFTGGIYGSVGDLKREAKREVLERISATVGAENMSSLVTIGDGPVEIRETRKRGGRTIGIASNEEQRFGLNETKRTRLIRAGAEMIIPDFSQMDALLSLLGV